MISTDLDVTETERRPHSTGYKSLWASVVFNAAKDALAPAKNRQRYIELERYQARRWFLDPSQDTYMVLNMAGLDPDYVIEHMRDLINGPDDRRAEVRKILYSPNRVSELEGRLRA